MLDYFFYLYIDAKRAAAEVVDSKDAEVVYEVDTVMQPVWHMVHIEKQRGYYYPIYEGNNSKILEIHEFWQEGQQKRFEVWEYRDHKVCIGKYEFEDGKITAMSGMISFEKKDDSCFMVQLHNGFDSVIIITDEAKRCATSILGDHRWHHSFAKGVRPLQICKWTDRIILMPPKYETNTMGSAISISKVQFDTCIDLAAVCSFAHNKEGNTLRGRFVLCLRRCMRRWLIRARRKKVQAVLIKPLAAVVCSYLLS